MTIRANNGKLTHFTIAKRDCGQLFFYIKKEVNGLLFVDGWRINVERVRKEMMFIHMR